jgi:hypothetical protein
VSQRRSVSISLLPDIGPHDSVVIVGKGRADTSVLVDFLGLGNDCSGLLVDFGRYSLVLANKFSPSFLVERVEEV